MMPLLLQTGVFEYVTAGALVTIFIALGTGLMTVGKDRQRILDVEECQKELEGRMNDVAKIIKSLDQEGTLHGRNSVQVFNMQLEHLGEHITELKDQTKALQAQTALVVQSSRVVAENIRELTMLFLHTGRTIKSLPIDEQQALQSIMNKLTPEQQRALDELSASVAMTKRL